MNYAPLITAWNLSSASPGALPGGVTGTSLFGLATEAKVTAINAWTVTGAVPTAFFVSGQDIWNCVVWSELALLTDAQRKDVLLLCGIGNGQKVLLGGSANAGLGTSGMILSYFGVGTATRANLTALAQGVVQPWWQANGFTGPFSDPDLQAAGGLT